MTLIPIEGGAGTPPEPDWTLLYTVASDREAASEAWNIVIAALSAARLLTTANAHAVQRLVTMRLIYDAAALDVAQRGMILKAPTTGTPAVNPHWSVMRQAARQLADHEAELGLSPRRRSAATPAPRRRPTTRAADEYLKPVGGS